MRRRLMICTLAGTLAIAPACKRQKPAPARETSDPLNHVATNVKPINFLRKTFTVKTSAHFAVEVPPHTAIPRIHGTFQSFVPRPGDDDLSDDTTDVQFLLMDPDQFSDYSHGQGGGTALYTVESTHSHEVEYVLPPTRDASAKYYVVFVNTPGGVPLKSVTADFSLSFGY
jgi:hypothetical protein